MCRGIMFLIEGRGLKTKKTCKWSFLFLGQAPVVSFQGYMLLSRILIIACKTVWFFCKHLDCFHRYLWRISWTGKHYQELAVSLFKHLDLILPFSCAVLSLNMTFNLDIHKRLQLLKNCAIFKIAVCLETFA